ncbi:MAG: NmrA/HSCARG family protein [Candidatus Eremiobacteraeota bacterium]|nr:NmrA/HSCARG family protein [Candidatus Eremiobacteraeota bacterium]
MVGVSKKIIAVIGSTGAQGGGLARAILSDRSGEFAVRALTRDPASDRAQELAKLGAEVVAADVDDAESLKKAFAGAYGAYCVTFYWAHLSPDREKAEAKAMAHAAQQAGLQHVIWSTLEDTRTYVPLDDDRMPTLMDKYKVPHFDAKGEADAYFIELGLPMTFSYASFYWENFLGRGMGPKRTGDGAYMLNLPLGNKRLTGIAAEDIGKCALGVFKRREEFIGKRIGLAGDALTGEQMAAAMSKALGKQIRYNAVPFEVFRSLGFPGAEDLGNMFQFYAEFEPVLLASRDINLSRSLDPELQSFEQWLDRNASAIPLE